MYEHTHSKLQIAAFNDSFNTD